jgi:hypothetical protein
MDGMLVPEQALPVSQVVVNVVVRFVIVTRRTNN